MLLALGSFLAGLNLASLELSFLGLVLALAFEWLDRRRRVPSTRIRDGAH
jgi:hypothetical protein